MDHHKFKLKTAVETAIKKHGLRISLQDRLITTLKVQECFESQSWDHPQDLDDLCRDYIIHIDRYCRDEAARQRADSKLAAVQRYLLD